MNKKTLTVVGIALITLVAGAFYLANQPEDETTMTQIPIVSSVDVAAECKARIAAQNTYLSKETFSDTYTFDKYPTTEEALPRLAPLDTSSSRSATEFRTKLSEAMGEAGINFDGHYSIVLVGMTGWGDNYWIIDRSTGKAYEVLYKATYLDFRRDSNLVVMDSKGKIENAVQEFDEPLNACASMGRPNRLVDLRPFYFIWEGKQLKLLAPTDIKPIENTFWHDYFN